MTDQARRCHLLIDQYGLRTFQGKLRRSNAGFGARAWKLDGETELRRDLPVDYFGNAISRLLLARKLKPGSAVVVEIAWPLSAPENEWIGPSAKFLRFAGPSTDQEMLALEAMARDPQPFHDTALGRFTRDDQLEWVEGEINWLGQSAKASFEAELDIDIAAQIPVLARLLDEQQDRDSGLRVAIIDGLYDLWSDTWRQDEPLVSPEEFAARMPIESIAIHRDGDFEIWLGDANYFWGHGVMVRGTLDGGFEPAEMHG